MKYENKMLTYENSLGLLIALLILFDFRFEKNIIDLINTPLGITSSLLVTIILLITMNPVIGILFLIYLYENIKLSDKPLIKDKKTINMEKMNPPKEDTVEEKIIKNKKPIINQGKHSNVSFKPLETTKLDYQEL